MRSRVINRNLIYTDVKFMKSKRRKKLKYLDMIIIVQCKTKQEVISFSEE